MGTAPNGAYYVVTLIDKKYLAVRSYTDPGGRLWEFVVGRFPTAG